MAGLYIPGLELPERGHCITITIDGEFCGRGTVRAYNSAKVLGEAIPLGEHGDLVDRELIEAKVSRMYFHKEEIRGAVLVYKKIVNAPAVIEGTRKYCFMCMHFIGGGDFDLCCDLRHEGYPCGFLCYADTPACDKYEAKEKVAEDGEEESERAED